MNYKNQYFFPDAGLPLALPGLLALSNLFLGA